MVGAEMLTNEEIVARIEQAFLPLRCVAEIRHGLKVRFRVLDARNNAVFRMKMRPLSEIRDETQLAQLHQYFRSRIRARGFTLK
jgi:hypothetical protein